MTIIDFFRNTGRQRREKSELALYAQRMQPYFNEEKDARLNACTTAVTQAFEFTGYNPKSPIVASAYQLCNDLLAFDGHFYLPAVDIRGNFTTGEKWELIERMQKALMLFENQEKVSLFMEALVSILKSLTTQLPPINFSEGEGQDRLTLTIPLYALIPSPASAIASAIRLSYSEKIVAAGFFKNLRRQLGYNICIASKIDPQRADVSQKAIIMPEKSDIPVEEMVTTYLSHTPFLSFFQTPLPFSIRNYLPYAVRCQYHKNQRLIVL